jgi:carboxymethylenebutenolidase
MPMTALEIAGPDGAIDATLHTPDGAGPWPGVLMLTDILGPRPTFQDMATRLAGHGYAVLLPNVYYREGRAPVPDLAAPLSDPETMKALLALMATLTPDRMRADGKALTEGLLGLNETAGDRIGAVGYCMSGQFAIYTAAAAGAKVAAAASYHGGFLIRDDADSPHKIAAGLGAALYFGHGENDETIPQARLPELESTLAQAGVDFASEVYEGSIHGFAVPGSQRWDEKGAERHWRTLTALMERTLKG